MTDQRTMSLTCNSRKLAKNVVAGDVQASDQHLVVVDPRRLSFSSGGGSLTMRKDYRPWWKWESSTPNGGARGTSAQTARATGAWVAVVCSRFAGNHSL